MKKETELPQNKPLKTPLEQLQRIAFENYMYRLSFLEYDNKILQLIIKEVYQNNKGKSYWTICVEGFASTTSDGQITTEAINEPKTQQGIEKYLNKIFTGNKQGRKILQTTFVTENYVYGRIEK